MQTVKQVKELSGVKISVKNVVSLSHHLMMDFSVLSPKYASKKGMSFFMKEDANLWLDVHQHKSGMKMVFVWIVQDSKCLMRMEQNVHLTAHLDRKVMTIKSVIHIHPNVHWWNLRQTMEIAHLAGYPISKHMTEKVVRDMENWLYQIKDNITESMMTREDRLEVWWFMTPVC